MRRPRMKQTGTSPSHGKAPVSLPKAEELLRDIVAHLRKERDALRRTLVSEMVTREPLKGLTPHEGLDLETPGLGGLLLVSAIKELAPGVPIVAVSTKPDPDARAVSQKGVAVAVLPSGHEAAPHPFLTALARIGRGGPALRAGSP